MQKNKYFCFIIASISLYFFLTISMEPPPPQTPITNNNAPIIPPLFPPISPNNKPILGFEIKDLSQLAPIAISMYCYNEFPRFTMVCLSLMLIYTLTTKEIYKKNIIICTLKKYRKKYINFSLRLVHYFKNKVSFFMNQHYYLLPERI